jgi:hypothetical protein
MNRWSHLLSLLLCTAILGRSTCLCADDAITENDIAQILFKDGVELASGGRVRLPMPLVGMTQDPDQQALVIDRLTQKLPRDEFVRNSVVAPFVVKIDTLEGAGRGGRAAQSIHLWFVAYGNLQTVRDEELLTNLIGAAKQSGPSTSSSESVAELLGPDDLQARNLSTSKTAHKRDSYVRLTGTVLDRVQVQGVWHILETSYPGAIVLASMLDSRFAGDSEYPNRWRSIRQDEFGKVTLGESQPYSGWGGYALATTLHEPAGAMLIECYTIFSEPAEWFGGTNQLRAKLPIVVQDNVRKFRRQLINADRAR